MMKHWVGAHVSAEKGVHEAIPRIIDLGGKSFAIFLKNQKRWVSPPLEETVAEQFKIRCDQSKIDTRKQILPHASYLINLGNPDKEKLEKAKVAMLDDLQRCEKCNIGLYNLHPGSSLGTDKDKAIEQIALSIDELIEKTSSVRIVLENMTGNEERIVGTRLEDLRKIIQLVKNKERIGVCIDTCHTFAAGYDLRTEAAFNSFWDKFEKVVGWKYLAGIHLNDSKHPLDSKRDVHQNIGLGFLGLEPFRLLMNNNRFSNIPLILETPAEGDTKEAEEEVRRQEIALLEWLIGKSSDDKDFIKKSIELQAKGEKQRNGVLEAIEKKAATGKGASRAKQSTLKFAKKVKLES